MTAETKRQVFGGTEILGAFDQVSVAGLFQSFFLHSRTFD